MKTVVCENAALGRSLFSAPLLSDPRFQGFPSQKPGRRTWECAVLLKLQEDLRLGNLSVRYSKRFGRFEEYFLPAEQRSPPEIVLRAIELARQPQGCPRGYRTGRLDRAYDLFLVTAPDNSFATVDEGGWHLSADATEKLDAETDDL